MVLELVHWKRPRWNSRGSLRPNVSWPLNSWFRKLNVLLTFLILTGFLVDVLFACLSFLGFFWHLPLLPCFIFCSGLLASWSQLFLSSLSKPFLLHRHTDSCHVSQYSQFLSHLLPQCFLLASVRYLLLHTLLHREVADTDTGSCFLLSPQSDPLFLDSQSPIRYASVHC